MVSVRGDPIMAAGMDHPPPTEPGRALGPIW